jgi:DNA-nicking Smr family endonuclease
LSATKPRQALSDLGALHAQVKAMAALELANKRLALAQAEQAARAKRAEHDLFVRAVGPVEPLSERHKSRKAWTPERLALPEPRQRWADDARVLQEAISDEFDASTLLQTDDLLSFKRRSLGMDVLKKLRRGDWSIQRHLDLHGFRREEAREALTAFIRDCHKTGIRCVRVVHGKGLGSPGKTPVLKSKVHGWLVQKAQVLAFVQAKPGEGGAGALVVLLAPRVAKPVAA